MIRLFFSLFAASVLLGCSYQYHLHIMIVPGASPEAEGGLPEPSPTPDLVKPNPAVAPQSQSGPLSIEPGQFSASQTKGGAMVNVILNLNSSKPTEVTTDATVPIHGLTK